MISSSSRCRPMSGVGLLGKVCRPVIEAPRRREPIGQVLGGELEEVLRLIEVLEPMDAEVAQTDRAPPRREQLRRRGRHEHLAAMAAPPDPRRPMDADPDVALVAGDGMGGVKAHPHLERTVVRPRVSRELPLRLDGRARRIVGRRNAMKKASPCVSTSLPPHRNAAAQTPLMIVERARRTARAELPKQPRRALDVGEQERDRSARALGHLPRA